MAYPTLIKDAAGTPISQEYVPGVGFIGLKGSANTNTDGSGNTTSAAMVGLDQSLVLTGQLQNAQAGNANGSTLTLNGMGSVLLEVIMASNFTGTVNIEGAGPNGTYDPLWVNQLGTNTVATTVVGAATTVTHLYEVSSIGGLQTVRARTSGVSGGTVTVNAYAVPLPSGARVVQANQAGTWNVNQAGTWNVNQAGTWNVNQAGTWTVQPGNTQNTTPWLVSSAGGSQATYVYAISATAPYATPTDWIVIRGSGSKTIKIVRIEISGAATAATEVIFTLKKHTIANTAGTSTTPTPMKHDSNDGAATATVLLYSAAPTIDASATIWKTVRMTLAVAPAATSVTPDRYVYDYGDQPYAPLVLRGVAQEVAINFAGAAVPAGGVYDVAITWVEL